jgi:hypothetical protein
MKLKIGTNLGNKGQNVFEDVVFYLDNKDDGQVFEACAKGKVIIKNGFSQFKQNIKHDLVDEVDQIYNHYRSRYLGGRRR